MMTLEQEIAQLKEENAKLKTAQQSRFKICASKTGGVMITGMRKFPITLYPTEWATIFTMQDAIKEFIKTMPIVKPVIETGAIA